MIVRVCVLLKRTVGDSNCRFNNLSDSHLQSQSDIVSSVDLVIDLIGQLNCHVRIVLYTRSITRDNYHPLMIQYHFDSEGDYRSDC